MATPIRLASFNVENLFSRAKILNLRRPADIDLRMKQVGELQKLIHKPTAFTATDKSKILQLLQELKPFVEIRENRGKLLNLGGTRVVAASGKDWDGEIEFKRTKFNEVARELTARVIKSVRADIACIIEAEDRQTLKSFDTDLLGSKYQCEMLIDGNDPRGIDVGVYSKFPIGSIRTHIFDKVGSSPTFSRDCPEYEIVLPGGQSLWMLCNHLKSKGYDTNGTADARRKRQAEAVAKLLQRFDLSRDLVVVAALPLIERQVI